MRKAAFLLFFLHFCGIWPNAQSQQPDECQCWISPHAREPCPAGDSLTEGACRISGCCFQDSADITLKIATALVEDRPNSPSCFTKRATCHELPQCRVEPRFRRACPYARWQSGRRMCQFRGCCFDSQQEPFCFRAENVHGNVTPFTPTVVRNSGRVDSQIKFEYFYDVMRKQLTSYHTSVAVRPTWAVLENGTKSSVQCVYSSSAITCGQPGATIQECVEEGCCWNTIMSTMFSVSPCVQPVIETLHHQRYRNPVQDYDKSKNESMYGTDAKQKYEGLKDEIIPHGNFGIFIKSCNDENRTPCKGNPKSREECFANSCCWKPTSHSLISCYSPMTTYQPGVKRPDPTDDSYLQWRPVNLDDLLNSRIDGSKERGGEGNDKIVTAEPSPFYNYNKVSVATTCPNEETLSSFDKLYCAGGYTRQLCMSYSCCWMNNPNAPKEGLCLMPKGVFLERPESGLFSDSSPGIIEAVNNTNFWIPSLPEITYIRDGVGLISVFCPKIIKENRPCGDGQVASREECVERGCCWRPWLAYEPNASFKVLCQAPEMKFENITMSRHTVENLEPLEPRWDEWMKWSTCKPVAACSSEGRQHRSRYCYSPLANIAGKDITAEETSKCVGAAKESRVCYDFRDCDLAAWGVWSPWSDCSESCQSGISTRLRSCEPVLGNVLCSFPDSRRATQIDNKTCNSEMCDRWSDWIDRGDCDAGCESNGTMTRFRLCNEFTVKEGRYETSETIAFLKSYNNEEIQALATSQPESLAVHEEECIFQTVPCQNGKNCEHVWGEWMVWSECDNECEAGKKIRFRQCLSISQYRDPIVISNFTCQEELGGIEFEEAACNGGGCQLWGDWHDMTECDAECEQDGEVVRERNCVNENFLDYLPPITCFERKFRCRGLKCPVAAWQEWGAWSSCSFLCSPGKRTRSRRCTMISDLRWVEPSLCGRENQETEPCNIFYCTRWGNWTDTECEGKCGKKGVKRSRRTCLSDDFRDVANDVSLAVPMLEKCYSRQKTCKKNCDIDWMKWTQWSPCSLSCSRGYRTRKRICFREDGIQHLNRFCPNGEVTEEEECNLHLCATRWTEYNRGECVGHCGKHGFQNSSRTCIGHDLDWLQSTFPDDLSTCYMNQFPCQPLCAKWNKWRDFGKCSNRCGPGKRTRRRLCMANDRIYPDTQCRPVQGPIIEIKDCNLNLCTSWGPWKNDYVCDGRCGELNGTRFRTRDCYSGVAPNHCLTSTISCVPECGIVWGPWMPWSPCSEMCGPGRRTRMRDCLQDGKKIESATCIKKSKNKFPSDDKEDTDSRECNSDFCPSWSEWNTKVCQAKCNETAFQKRNRNCLLKTSLLVPKECWADTVECVGNCVSTWGLWTEWTTCTSSCGPGKQTSVRRCTLAGKVVSPSKCNQDGKARAVRTRECNTMMCNTWGKWVSGNCAVICGGAGIATRSRECVGKGLQAPRGQLDDKNCYEKKEFCGTDPCPVSYQPWSEWGECSNLCSPGVKTRTRKCVTNGYAEFGDCSALGSALEEKPCNRNMCPKWRPWRFYTPCSGNCGVPGVRLRWRTCKLRSMTQKMMQKEHSRRCFQGEVPCRKKTC